MSFMHSLIIFYFFDVLHSKWYKLTTYSGSVKIISVYYLHYILYTAALDC